MRTRSIHRAATAAALSLLLVTATGCTQLVDAFNGMQPQEQEQEQDQEQHVVPTPAAPSAEVNFESQFTDDGSVSLSTDVADELEVRLDVWAKDPKQTMRWTPQNPKVFGLAVNVYDHRVDEKAVLKKKRRVYISNIAISSQTAQTSMQTSAPFQFSADPRTLVPSDTLRNKRGLLLNSYQGGLLIPELTINTLPEDTYGLTLQFTFTVDMEGAANDSSSFQAQTVYQTLPIAIFPNQG